AHRFCSGSDCIEPRTLFRREDSPECGDTDAHPFGELVLSYTGTTLSIQNCIERIKARTESLVLGPQTRIAVDHFSDLRRGIGWLASVRLHRLNSVVANRSVEV